MTVTSARQEGFTLIEIMVVVAIIAILAAIAYPSYQRYVLRSHRAEGISQLMVAAGRQEVFYARAFVFTDDLGSLGLNELSENGFYALSIELDDDKLGYTLKATPKGAQTRDGECASLSLTSDGVRDATGSLGAACWR